MRISHTPKLWRIQHDSLPDVMRYLTNTPRVWAQTDSEAYSGGASWDLNAGWEGTLQLCRTGWAEGGQKMRLILKQLGKVSIPLVEHKYNMEAGAFNMGRYMTGNPDCFKAKVKSRASANPTVRFAVNISANGTVTAEAFANAGAAIAQAVKQLEARGNKVEVTAYDASLMREGRRIVTGWNVKRATGKLDMAALAFSIAHPAAMRRVGFALMERAPLSFSTGHYGSASELLPSDLEHGDAIIFNVAMIANETCKTPEQAVETVQGVIARQR